MLDGWGRLAAEWLDLDAISGLRDRPRTRNRGASDRARSIRVRGRAADRRGVRRGVSLLLRRQFESAALARRGDCKFFAVPRPKLPDVDGLTSAADIPRRSRANCLEHRDARGDSRLRGRGDVIYAECGGLMYLTEGIKTLDGARWPMAAIIPGVAVMSDRLQALGYVEVETRADSILGPAGTRFRGHQFRHSTLEDVERRPNRHHIKCSAAMGWRAVRRRLSRRKCSRFVCSRALGVESRARGGPSRRVHSFARIKTTGCIASRIAVISSDRAQQNRNKDRTKIPGDFPAAPLTLKATAFSIRCSACGAANCARSKVRKSTPQS